MEKMVIAGRTNWEHKIFIRFKSSDCAIRVIKKIAKELGDEYFIDNPVIPKVLSPYEKWKDQWIPLGNKDFGMDIICGDKLIHMIIYKFQNFESVSNLLDKYCEWAEIKYKKRSS